MAKVFDMEAVKASITRDLPLLAEINDPDLRAKVVEAWALSLTENGYACLDDVPRAGRPEGAELGSQAGHLLGVTKIALAIAAILEESVGAALGIDSDILIACGLCHDLGNPYEFNETHRARWQADSRPSGAPALRHTFYGAHIALTVGLPEAVAHVCACHSAEGAIVKRSLPAHLLYYADQAYWHILENAFQWNISWLKKSD